jgi:hypothetical protein
MDLQVFQEASIGQLWRYSSSNSFGAAPSLFDYDYGVWNYSGSYWDCILRNDASN